MKLGWRIAVAVTVLGVAILTLAWADAWRQRRDVAEVLTALRKVRNSAEPQSELRLLAKKLPLTEGTKPCRGTKRCQSFTFIFSNRWMATLGLASEKIFRGEVFLDDAGKYFGFDILAGQGSPNVGSFLMERNIEVPQGEFPFRGFLVIDKDYIVDAYLTSRSSDEQRAAVLDMDLSFITAFGRLHSARSLFKRDLNSVYQSSLTAQKQ
jgi:hypothetical protein